MIQEIEKRSMIAPHTSDARLKNELPHMAPNEKAERNCSAYERRLI